MKRKNTVFLIGLSGSGKSTLASLLKKEAGCQVCDTDAEVEQKIGKSITEIFRVEGEQYFRDQETEALKEAISKDLDVIATGGGIFIKPENRELMLASGTVVYLRVRPDVLASRLKDAEEDRPLLVGPGKAGANQSGTTEAGLVEKLKKLLAERESDYKLSDLEIDTTWATESQVSELLKLIKQTSDISDSSTDQRELQTQYVPTKYPNGRESLHVTSSGLRQQISSYIRLAAPNTKKLVVVSDSGVTSTTWHQELLRNLKNDHGKHFDLYEKVVLRGETSKSLESFGNYLSEISELGLSREDTILAIGGGVVGDLVGFIASTYLRGVNLIHYPTSVVAQVDSAIGGKTGINLPVGKNLVGTFYPANAVLSDVDALETLSEREYCSGLAEVVKYGLVFSNSFLSWLEDNTHSILARDKRTLIEMIGFCSNKKVEVVSSDLEDKKGLRAKLNFGHTLGHGIEKMAGYGTYLHGEAISLGMIFALTRGVELGQTDSLLIDRAKRLLGDFNLPVKCQAKSWFSSEKAGEESLVKDWEKVLLADKKKASSGDISFVLVSRAGESCLVKQRASELVDSFVAKPDFWG